MQSAISSDLLRALTEASPERIAAVRSVLGLGANSGMQNDRCGMKNADKDECRTINDEVRIRIGRFSYLPGFNQVWLGHEVFDLSRRTKARLCIQYLVEAKAFDAASARHLTDEIDPYVRKKGDFLRAADIRIYHYFGDRNGPLTKLRKALIKSTAREGRFYLGVE